MKIIETIKSYFINDGNSLSRCKYCIHEKEYNYCGYMGCNYNPNEKGLNKIKEYSTTIKLKSKNYNICVCCGEDTEYLYSFKQNKINIKLCKICLKEILNKR